MLTGKVFRNLATYSIADILGKSVLLLLSPILTRVLTPSQYGAIPLLTALWAVISIIQFGGFDTAFYMFRAQTTDVDEKERIRITSTTMGGIFLVILWIIIAAFSLLTDVVINYVEVSRLELLFFLLAIIPSSLAYLSIFVFRYMHLAKPYVRINLINKVVSILIALPFVMMAKQENRLLVMFLVIFIAQTLSLFWVYREFKILKIPIVSKESFQKKMALKMFKFGVVFIPSSIIYSSTVYIDRLLLGYFSTPDQVAVLGLAVSLSSGVLMIRAWFSLIWDPILIDWLATKNPAIYLGKLQTVLPILSILFFSLSVFAKLWGQFVVDFVYPSHFAEVGQIIPILVLSGGVSVLTLVAIATAIIENTARFRIQIYSGALIVNVVIAFILIPKLGIRGAALGTLFSEVFVLLSWIFIGRFVLKNLNLSWVSPLFLSLLTFLFIMAYQPGYVLNVVLEQVILTMIFLSVLAYVAINSKIAQLFRSKI